MCREDQNSTRRELRILRGVQAKERMYRSAYVKRRTKQTQRRIDDCYSNPSGRVGDRNEVDPQAGESKIDSGILMHVAAMSMLCLGRNSFTCGEVPVRTRMQIREQFSAPI